MKPEKPIITRDMPEPPDMDEKYIQNCEIAKAKAINSLSDTKKNILEMLSSIRPEEVDRLSLLLSIADDKELNLGDENSDNNFLHDYVYHQLKLSNSQIIPRGGIRSEQLKELVKSPDLEGLQSEGIISKIRNRITR